ncbi:MAG: VOC family protein [Salinibacterium sp.]|nr:VOC family protein [Salinibacterium sp.]MBF0673330.1 VOC family protein [Salinibacterium sp.]
MAEPVVDTERRSGAITWAGLVTPDAVAAEEFYAAVLGWRFMSSSLLLDVPFDVRVATAGSVPVASIQQGIEELEFPAVWNAYFAVDDLDDAVARAKANGAIVLAEPFQVGGGEESAGSVAFLLDPNGAGFCLWQTPGDLAPVSRAEPGFITWTVLYADETLAGADFYAKTLGWQIDEPSPLDDYRLARLPDGSRVAAVRRLQEGQLPCWRTYFCVADLDAALMAAVTRGGTVLTPPSRIQDGRMFAIVADPSGARFGMMQAD